MRVFLGLGTNLGDREMNLVTAKDLLMKKGVMILGQSSVDETIPLGGMDQPKYLNQVVECETGFLPEELLILCKTVEKEMGRPVVGERWGARIIDIDILFYGNEIVDTLNLKIPHVGVVERDFVMEELLELAPDFVHPVLKKSIRELSFLT